MTRTQAEIGCLSLSVWKISSGKTASAVCKLVPSDLFKSLGTNLQTADAVLPLDIFQTERLKQPISACVLVNSDFISYKITSQHDFDWRRFGLVRNYNILNPSKFYSLPIIENNQNNLFFENKTLNLIWNDCFCPNNLASVPTINKFFDNIIGRDNVHDYHYIGHMAVCNNLISRYHYDVVYFFVNLKNQKITLINGDFFVNPPAGQKPALLLLVIIVKSYE